MSTVIRYERRGNRVVPVRVVKQWVASPKDGRRFMTVRVTQVKWSELVRAEPPEPVASCRVTTPNRADLVSRGFIAPAGVGPCLGLDDWAVAVSQYGLTDGAMGRERWSSDPWEIRCCGSIKTG